MAIKIGLIGAGRMGRVYADTLSRMRADVVLTGVADQNASLARQTAEDYRISDWYSDYHQLLANSEVDAVVVATSTHTHVSVVVDAARSGKHIFCEKPLALDLAGCDQALAAVNAAGVKFMVGFMRRFDPSYVKAKQLITEGAIGTPVMYKGVGRDPGCPDLKFAPRAVSGGLIMDMGIHDFDLARWLMGSEVQSVSTAGGCLVFPELAGVGDIDNAVINLQFENGAVGNIDVSRNAVYGYDIRTEILGSKGALTIQRERKSDTIIYTRAGVVHDTIPAFMERFADAYQAEITEFAHALNEGRAPAVGGWDARAATAIGIGATISLDEHRVVNLEEVTSPGDQA
jgi:inositol 2-dehydrogenase